MGGEAEEDWDGEDGHRFVSFVHARGRACAVRDQLPLPTGFCEGSENTATTRHNMHRHMSCSPLSIVVLLPDYCVTAS